MCHVTDQQTQSDRFIGDDISKDRQSLRWDCMKQDEAKALGSSTEELHDPGATQASHQGVNSPTPNIYRVTFVPFTCQMLSGMLRNNHDDKTEPALHGVSLKPHEFVVLKLCFRPTCKHLYQQQFYTYLLTAHLLHSFGSMLLKWNKLNSVQKKTHLQWKKDICRKYPVRAVQDLAISN